MARHDPRNVDALATAHERILAHVDTWIPRLGLDGWELEVVFLDSWEGTDECEDDFRCTATCESRWNYLQAKIKFYNPSLLRHSDRVLEETVVHELCHVLLAAEQSCIRKDPDMEKLELSTETAARAFMRAWTEETP